VDWYRELSSWSASLPLDHTVELLLVLLQSFPLSLAQLPVASGIFKFLMMAQEFQEKLRTENEFVFLASGGNFFSNCRSF
jgi:hypothetical protein